MVAQVTRPLPNGPQPAAQTRHNGAYTLEQFLCALDARTLLLGHQSSIDRPILIERIHPIASDLAAAAYVKRQDVLSLGHINIAQPLDVFVEDGQLYTAMCAGAGTPLMNHALLTQAHAVAYGIDICNALSYLQLHHQHLDAADISPCTIFITEANRARLTCMAALLGAHTPTTSSRFVAQTGEGEEATVFSLGATLHYALSGWYGAYYDTPPALTGVSPDCNAVIMKALAPNPTDRYTTIADLRKALLRL